MFASGLPLYREGRPAKGFGGAGGRALKTVVPSTRARYAVYALFVVYVSDHEDAVLVIRPPR